MRYSTAEASLAAEGLVGPAQVEWLDRVRDDLESYRGALTWLIDHDRPAEACRHRVELVLLLGHPWACGRGPPVVRTDPEPALASAGCRIESAARNGSDAVHARRTRARTQRAHARSRARPRDRRHGDDRARPRICWETLNTPSAMRTRPASTSPAVIEGFRALALPWGLGNSLTGMAAVVLATGDPRTRSACSMRPHRCFDTLRRGSCRGRCIFAPSWRCGAGTPMRRSRSCEKASHYIRQLHDKFAFVLRARSLSPRRRCSRATTSGRRESWAPGTPSRNAPAPLLAEKSVDDLKEQAERGGACPPRAGSVGRGVRSRASDVHRFVAEGHRRHRAKGMTDAPAAADRQARTRATACRASRGKETGLDVAHARQHQRLSGGRHLAEPRRARRAAPASGTRSAPMRAGSVRVAAPAAHR